ncbi:MAG: leucine-rich repeat protein [Oscillospiraceae bacterium]|nr:leucine-rich repeat protein [Oscillospiraceae bacterium]
MGKLKARLASLTALSCCCINCLPITEQILPMHSIIANAGEVVTSGTCGENLTWSFEESTVTLTISGTSAMENWGFADPFWYHLHEDIKKIILEDGVTTIGYGAFYHCSALESVTIPNGVKTIGYATFFHCSALKSVIIPNSVTIIGNNAFTACYALTSFIIPDSVTTIGTYAFTNCDSLTSVSISDSMTSIEESDFYHCFSLEFVVIPDSVTIINNHAFSYCPALESIVIPDSVTTIGRGTFDCDSLTSVTIENPECEIYDEEYTISDTATIYGYDNSTAQAYAEIYHRNFVSLGTAPSSTDTSTPWNSINPDINGDSKIDASDATLILIFSTEYGAGNISSFGEFYELICFTVQKKSSFSLDFLICFGLSKSSLLSEKNNMILNFII